MIALGAKYHVSCLAARVNRERQPNTGKVIVREEMFKRSFVATRLLRPAERNHYPRLCWRRYHDS